MFEAYSVVETTYTTNSIVQFTQTAVTDPRIEMSNSTISISTPGKYLVKFYGVGGSSTAESDFTVQLYKNNVAVPYAISNVTSTAAGDENTLCFESILTVPRSCCIVDNTVNLNVMVTSTAAGIMTLSNIIIVKLR